MSLVLVVQARLGRCRPEYLGDRGQSHFWLHQGDGGDKRGFPRPPTVITEFDSPCFREQGGGARHIQGSVESGNGLQPPSQIVAWIELIVRAFVIRQREIRDPIRDFLGASRG